MEFLPTHLGLVVPFIYLHQGVVKLPNLWKGNLGLQSGHECNLPKLTLYKATKEINVVVKIFHINKVLMHHHPLLKILLIIFSVKRVLAFGSLVVSTFLWDLEEGPSPKLPTTRTKSGAQASTRKLLRIHHITVMGMVQLSIIQVNINRMMLVTETSNIARNQLAATFRWLTEVEESLGSFINGGSNGGCD